MKRTYLALGLSVVFFATKATSAQDIFLAPLQFYGKATATPHADATLSDHKIASWLGLEYSRHAELATAVKEKAMGPHIKRLAESIVKDSEIARDKLSKWSDGFVAVESAAPSNVAPLMVSLLSTEAEKLDSVLVSLNDKLPNVPDQQDDETYLQILRSLSKRQVDLSKVLAPSVSPGFRNEIENMREASWKRSQASAHLIALLKSETPSIARR